MYAAGPTLEFILRQLSWRLRPGRDDGLTARLLPIVFAGPWSTVLWDVAEHKPWLDVRTGDKLDIYFAGVLTDHNGVRLTWARDDDYGWIASSGDPELTVLAPALRPYRDGFHHRPPFDWVEHRGGWVWSPRAFNRLRMDIEAESGGRWRYSGNSDLLLMNVLVGADVAAPTIDWESVVSIALEGFDRRSEGRWFGEVVETLARSSAEETSDPYWGMQVAAQQDPKGFGGSLASRALKYFVLEGLGPWAIGQAAGSLFR